MTRRWLLMSASLACVAIGGVFAQEGTGSPLAPLEARLRGDPDSLEAANAYRRMVIQTGEYDRALRFFEALVTAHPNAANAHLNYGFAYVDKIPVAGSISQVILADAALRQFTESIQLRPSWIAYYTRGASYLFWPRIFGRAPLGIADLEQALRMQTAEPKHSYHVRTFVTLGDGYWRVDDPTRAVAMWRRGLDEFPGTKVLEARLAAARPTLAHLIDDAFDPSRRVDTDLSELWSQR